MVAKQLILTVILLVTAGVSKAGVILTPGDSATFKFDFGATDISAETDILYTWTVTTADGSSPQDWTGSVDLFDELSEPAFISQSADYFSGFGLGAPNDLGFEGLFDDPISFITVTYTDTFDPPTGNSVMMSIAAETASSRFTAEGNVVSDVPIPSSLALIGLGLAGLGYSRRRL